MSEYLRDFIEENVGPECGGTGGLVSPDDLQTRINELSRRVDQLEAGIGFTIKIRDSINLPCQLSSEALYTVVPTEGKLTRLTLLSTEAGEATGITGANIRIHHGDSVTDTPVDMDHTKETLNTVIEIQVYTGDWIEITGTSMAVDPGEEGPEPLEPAKIRTGYLTMELPVKTYSVEKS